MSRHTQCNKCKLEVIKRKAKRDGMKVTLIHTTGDYDLSGTEVLVHPHNEVLNREKHFVSWMWEIPTFCAC